MKENVAGSRILALDMFLYCYS